VERKSFDSLLSTLYAPLKNNYPKRWCNPVFSLVKLVSSPNGEHILYRKNLERIMINFIRTSKTGYILGLILLTIVGISAGCSAKAEPVKQSEPPAQKKEVVAATQAPEIEINRNPYSEMSPDPDLRDSTPEPPKSTVQLNKAAFDKIKVGMTLNEIEKLLGDKGMLVSTMDVNGKQTQIYKWSNDNFTSYIDVTIEKNKVIEKKDKGLK